MTWPNEAAVGPCSLGLAGLWHSTAGMAPVGFQVQEGNSKTMEMKETDIARKGHSKNTFYQRTFREFHHASTIADFCFHPFARTFSEPTPEDFRDDASEAANATTDAPLGALALDEPTSAPKKQMRGPSVPNRHGIEHQIKLFGHIENLSDQGYGEICSIFIYSIFSKTV